MDSAVLTGQPLERKYNANGRNISILRLYWNTTARDTIANLLPASAHGRFFMDATGQKPLFSGLIQTLPAKSRAEKSRTEKEPILVSLCFLGVPCRWHGRCAKRRDDLLEKLKKKYVIVPVCPEQLGGMPTPRTGETLRGGTGAQVLDEGWKLLTPGTNEDVTAFHVNGSYITLEIAHAMGARRAYLKGGSPSCDKNGVTGEVLKRGGIQVVRIE